MSIRSMIRAALAGIAKLVLVPVELVVAGVRMVVQMLLPARNTAAFDDALDVVAEESATEAAEALSVAKTFRKAPARASKAERVRQAARDLTMSRPVSRHLFNASMPEEREVLEWLSTLDQLHLGHLVNAFDREIEDHLAGHKSMPMPLLAADEEREEARREYSRPLSQMDWIKELLRRRGEAGLDPDGDCEAEVIAEAKLLADRGASLESYRPAPVNEDRDEVA